MSNVPSELRDDIPTFDDQPSSRDHGPIDWTGLTSVRTAKSALEIGTIVGLALAIFFGLEPSCAGRTRRRTSSRSRSTWCGVLWNQFGPVFAHHLWVTMYEFLAGFAIGASIGLVLAALITQKPFAEKVIAPYILIMVMTPMIALVPFLRLKMGFGSWPLIIAVALASGPMVMLNSATGFRRTDLAKIALARSYGASTFQIFRKIRFPLALPMIIVGFMVGSIFGLLTAVGGEMVAPSEAGGLGERLVYYSSLARMDEFGAVIAIVAALGVGIYVLFYFIGKRWASWEA